MKKGPLANVRLFEKHFATVAIYWLWHETSSPMSPPLDKRVPALDGIRGVAISMVLVYHAIVVFASFPIGSLAARGIAIGRLWWNGVDLFFVLSGFLIGGILLDAKESPRYYQAFYARRIFRILPLYFLLLGCYWIFAPILPTFGRPLPSWSYVPLVQNFFIASSGAFGVAWLGVTWSLAIEEQFYLIAPTLIRSLNLAWLRRVIVGTIIVAPVIRIALFSATAHGYIAAMVLVISRADVLMFGVGAALIVRDRTLSRQLIRHQRLVKIVTGFLGLAIVMFTLKNWNLQTLQMVAVGYSIQGAFFAAIVLLTVQAPTSWLAKLLSIRSLRFLGVRAYGLYLIHVPLLYLAFMAAGYDVPRVTNWFECLITLGALAVAFALASLSWKYIEVPLIAVGHRISYQKGSSVPQILPYSDQLSRDYASRT